MYLTAHIRSIHVQRPKAEAKKNRSVSRAYFLKNSTGQELRVCLKFFCATFAVSTKMVQYTMQNTSPLSRFHMTVDNRKGRRAHNVTPPEDIDFAKKHIDSFPRVPAHYCRKDSKREYLSSELNFSLIYRLYVEKCKQEERRSVCKTLYKKLFDEHDPPLSFYTPKKDQCPLCNVFKQFVQDGVLIEEENPECAVLESGDGPILLNEGILNEDNIEEVLKFADTDVGKFEQEYRKHTRREKAAMNMKDEDKKRAEEDVSFRAITFDLQAILQLPYAAENQLYYVRKLNVYNFTIYDSFDRSGHAFLWDELNGKKGSNEIASFLLDYLQSLPEHVNHVASFSDTCGGQNRNRNVTGAMIYAIQTIPNLKIIDLKFMESGHSYLEADSMHARIEESRKHKRLYTVQEYGVVIQGARLNPKPYAVNSKKFNQIYDWKEFSKVLMSNVKKITSSTGTDEPQTVEWLKIKWLRFEKEEPNVVQFKYDLLAKDFFEFDVTFKNSKRMIRFQKTEIAASLPPVKEAYQSQIPVAAEKKNDLMKMIKKGIIPPDYKLYYENLPSVEGKTSGAPKSKKSRVIKKNNNIITDDTESSALLKTKKVAVERKAVHTQKKKQLKKRK